MSHWRAKLGVWSSAVQRPWGRYSAGVWMSLGALGSERRPVLALGCWGRVVARDLTRRNRIWPRPAPIAQRAIVGAQRQASAFAICYAFSLYPLVWGDLGPAAWSVGFHLGPPTWMLMVRQSSGHQLVAAHAYTHRRRPPSHDESASLCCVCVVGLASLALAIFVASLCRSRTLICEGGGVPLSSTTVYNGSSSKGRLSC